jgi:NitT/TauT family transport system substrate-binding protein
VSAERLALIAACALLLGACVPPPAAPTPTPAGAPIPLALGYSNISADELAGWVAFEAGIFAQHGLDVRLELLGGGSKAMAALLAGQDNLTLQGGSEVLSATSSGADLVILATLAPVYPYLLEVSPDIQTANDLRGKKVQISSAGSSGDIATRVVLKRQGLDPDADVAMVQTGSHTNGTAAMLSGQVQGGLDDPPASYELERHGLHPLFDLAALKLPAANTVLVGQRAWVGANHDTVQRVVDSLVQAIARIRADKPLAVSVLKKYYQSDDDEAMSGTYDFFSHEVLPAIPLPAAEQFNDALTILGEKNERIKSIDVSKLIDPSFVRSAVDRGLAAADH